MNESVATTLGFLRRNATNATCVVIVLACSVASWIWWSEGKELEVVRQERSREGEAMLALLVGGSTQRQELAVVREAVLRIEDNLVAEANLAENLWYFYKLEEQTKVRLPELHQLNSPMTDTSPFFRRVPYTLRVTGTFEQVSAFVLALETGPRLAKITSFTFTGGASIVLDLSVEILGKK